MLTIKPTCSGDVPRFIAVAAAPYGGNHRRRPLPLSARHHLVLATGNSSNGRVGKDMRPISQTFGVALNALMIRRTVFRPLLLSRLYRNMVNPEVPMS